jgi:hypothetical protein
MKKFLIILSIVSLSPHSLTLNQQPEPKPEALFTQQRVVDLPLPKPSFRPKLTLQRALQLAESYIAKEKIDLSSYYLYQAKYILYGNNDNQEPCWFFWWVNESGALGNYIEIIVSVETGNISRLPSM